MNTQYLTEQSQIVGLSDKEIGPKALCLPKRKLVELLDPYWMPQKGSYIV